MSTKILAGMTLLRYLVDMFNRCNETFNDRFSAEELIRIAECMQKCKWDIWPDQWEERQVQECVQLGITPDWEDKDGKIVPKYHNGKQDDAYMVAVTWSSSATVQVYAPSLKAAKEWSEGDMPLPKNGEYIDDSFDIDVDTTQELNPNEG